MECRFLLEANADHPDFNNRHFSYYFLVWVANSLLDITNNFRLGFGTFVDKVLMPYTAWTEEM